MTAVWQAGKTYVPGSLVVPTSKPPPAQVALENPSFEAGNLSGWDTTGTSNWSIHAGGAYAGAYCARAQGGGLAFMTNDARAVVTPGLTLTASFLAKITNSGTDDNGAQIILVWFDSGGAEIPGAANVGNLISGVGGSWKTSTVSGKAPANATHAAVRLGSGTGSHGGIVDFDAVTWSYNYGGPPAGLVYEATQADPGKSGATEPTWPGNTTTTVTDNQVTWQGVYANQIVWEAHPINKSGATEPTWDAVLGAATDDSGTRWVAHTPVVEDTNCPHSDILAIAAGKVFSGDSDIVRFSATNNPLDWTTAKDAGFIASGLNSVQETVCTALALYRGNLGVFTASCLQLWKADPDPAAIVILDTVESVGTSYPRGSIPVEQDCFFVSAQGIRSISVSASQQAMGAGDIGNPMDLLVSQWINAGRTPLACFFPNIGQMIVFFGKYAAVLARSQIQKVTAWSWYELPIEVTDTATLNGNLYIRDASKIYLFDLKADADYGTYFDTVLEWPFLDLGVPGTRKTITGVSMRGNLDGVVQLRLDPYNLTKVTTPKRMPRGNSDAFCPLPAVVREVAPIVTFSSKGFQSFNTARILFKPTRSI